jgi:hypothetical protein
VDGGLADSEHLEDLVSDDASARSRAHDGAPRLVARLAPATGARAGSRITLGVESDSIYAFDASSGRLLAGVGADASRNGAAAHATRVHCV